MTRFADISVRGAVTKSSSGYGLDSSGYHPLEHSLADCSAKLKHIRLWWSYFGQERVEQATVGGISRLVRCRFNKHWWLASWDMEDQKNSEICNWCEATR